MSEFGAAAMLEVSVSDSSLRSARQTIEDELGSVTVDVAGGGGAGGRRPSQQLRTDGGLGMGSAGGGSLPSLAKDRNETLVEILDTLEEMGGGLGGGGGGGGGGGVNILPIGAAGAAGGAASGLVGGLTGGALGTAGAGFATAAGAGLAGAGAGLAGVAGLDQLGALRGARGLGQGIGGLGGGNVGQAAFKTSQFADAATGGIFGGAVTGGAQAIDLVRGNSLNGQLTQQARSRYTSPAEIGSDVFSGDIQKPDWLGDGLSVQEPGEDFWPGLPKASDVENFYPGLPKASDIENYWPDLPKASDVESYWPDLPKASDVESYWPDIPLPDQSDLPKLDIIDDLPTLEVNVPDALQSAGDTAANTARDVTGADSSSNPFDANNDGDVNLGDAKTAFERALTPD